MAMRSVAQVVARTAIVLAMSLVMVPLVGDPAAAGRFGVDTSGAVDTTAKADEPAKKTPPTGNKPGTATTFSDEEMRARAVAREIAEEEAKNAPPPPPRAAVVRIVKKPVRVVPADIDVAGCGAGMACIVCVAGCNGSINTIVHAMPKATRR